METQQNSDTTYRLYDYGRPRELHIEDGLAALKEETNARTVPELPMIEDGNTRSNLLTSSCFVVDKFRLPQSRVFDRKIDGSANLWCLVTTHGCGQLEFGELPPIQLCTGEAVVIPAAVKQFMLKPRGELEFLCSWIPVPGAAQDCIQF